MDANMISTIMSLFSGGAPPFGTAKTASTDGGGSNVAKGMDISSLMNLVSSLGALKPQPVADKAQNNTEQTAFCVLNSLGVVPSPSNGNQSTSLMQMLPLLMSMKNGAQAPPPPQPQASVASVDNVKTKPLAYNQIRFAGDEICSTMGKLGASQKRPYV